MSKHNGKGNLKTGFWLIGCFVAVFGLQNVFAADAPKKADSTYKTKFAQAEHLAQSSSVEDQKKAVSEWKAMLKDYPNDLAISNNLAATLMKQKKYAEAQDYLESALNADPKIAVVMDNLNDIYAYQAQLAYQSVFKPSEINYPKGKWVALANEVVKTPEKAQLDKAKRDMERVLNQVENWRLAWTSRDVSAYLSFYKSDYHSDKFASHHAWVENRKQSLRRPKYIKIQLKHTKIVPLAKHTFQVSFIQNYHSNRFKDSVKKYLVWQAVGKSWKIIQEKVIYD